MAQPSRSHASQRKGLDQRFKTGKKEESTLLLTSLIDGFETAMEKSALRV